MQPKRLTWWLVLAALGVLALAGCAPRPGQGQTAAQKGSEQLAVDLPALVIDVDADGNFSLGGTPLATLAASFGAAGLDSLKLTPDQVSKLTQANVQHIQINNMPDGLKILVNGEEIPTLTWDANSLGTLQSLAGNMGNVLPPVLQKILPVLGKIGAGVTVRFPLAQGAEPIPLEVTGAGSSAAAAQEAQQAFLTSVGNPPRIIIPIQYDADGNWKAADMSQAEWITLTGQSALENLHLSPDTLAGLKAAGVTDLKLSTDADGIHVSVNGKALPSVNWGQGRLSHALTLAASAGLLGDTGGAKTDSLTSAVEALLPMLTSSQVEVHVTFPG